MKTIKQLSKLVVEKLTEKSYTIATAESLTGGGISSAITSIPGASNVFELGICTYASRMKEDFFHLENELKTAKTAVAKDVAIGMADGIRKIANSTFGIATTGLAGPADDGINHVGTVFIAVSWAGGCRVSKLELGDIGRDKICNETIVQILKMALDEIQRF